MAKYFMSYGGAKEASNRVVKLLNSEGFKTEFLKIEVTRERGKFLLSASSTVDPQMVSRFNHLLKEYTRINRNYTSV